MNYRVYRCSGMEILYCLLISFCSAGLIAWLFYRSCIALFLILLLFPVCCSNYKKEQEKKRKLCLLHEFKDGMQMVSTAMLAGYSMENAWVEAENGLKELYGGQSLLYREFQQMNAAVKMNQPLEQVLEAFAKRSNCEDIESFSEVFSFAKRSGGDFAGIISTTVQKISGRMEVEREIQTVIAGKKMEGKIMNVMPLFILAYLNITSGDFLEPLYGNVSGVLIMSVALMIYIISMKLSERVMDIKV